MELLEGAFLEEIFEVMDDTCGHVYVSDAPNEAQSRKNEWRILNDADADWAIEMIGHTEKEIARLEQICNERINRIKEAYERQKKQAEYKIEFFKTKLREYYESVPDKEKRKQKTQITYKLVTGSMGYKKLGDKYERDDDKLLESMENNGLHEYIITKKTVDWKSLKDNLMFAGDKAIIPSTGVVVEGIKVVHRPDEFFVKPFI